MERQPTCCPSEDEARLKGDALNKARDDIDAEFHTIAGCLISDHYEVFAVRENCSVLSMARPTPASIPTSSPTARVIATTIFTTRHEAPLTSRCRRSRHVRGGSDLEQCCRAGGPGCGGNQGDDGERTPKRLEEAWVRGGDAVSNRSLRRGGRDLSENDENASMRKGQKPVWV